MNMKDTLCFFDQHDGHWYLVDSSKREEWSLWKELDDDDPQCNVAPKFATMVNHPNQFEVVVCENTQEGQNLDIRNRKYRICMRYDAAEQTVRKSRGKAMKTLQSQCSHPKVTYYPDASGNNDSYHACDDCDKEM